MFADVHEIEPGTLTVVSARTGARTTHRYWSPRFRTNDGAVAGTQTPSVAEAVESLRSVLTTAARLRISRADVPVGAYLSGGLDSSVVASLARDACTGRFRTFSLRFADAEYDETPFQREMVARLGSEHSEIVVHRSDIARVFPAVVRHTERVILRTAPAPLHLLSSLVREHGTKVVLTGEGADEVLLGYDLFRETKIRRFWAKQPESAWRPRLFDRLYPYLARSPAHARGMALKFWSAGLTDTSALGYSHAPRWRATAALKRLFAPDVRAALETRDAVKDLENSLPSEFTRWEPLAQAQFLEMHTLLANYLLASQGDRMLMANGVEGRFPFLDRDVVEFANALPANYKLHGLDEKYLLKCVARDCVPESIVRRAKQPYRAPDALAFVTDSVPEYVTELFSASSLRRSGLFDPKLAEGLLRKCIERAASGEPLSNSDNMAFVGVLSAELLSQQFVARSVHTEDAAIPWTTRADYVDLR